jgi:type IV secretory pathway VirB10-like protein
MLLGLSGMAWTQQNPAPPSAPPSSPPSNQDASGLNRDLSFPEDTPAPSADDPAKKRVPNMEPPRSDSVQVEDLEPGIGDSSSKDTQTDLDAPPDDAKAHPQSSEAVNEAEAKALGTGGISEVRVFDPHKAAKDVEVGDFYFKRKNYHAAEDRYREALLYKDNDAVATIRLALCLEKLGVLEDARAEYESYLRILPHGPQAGEAQKAINRLKAKTAGTDQP